MRRWDWPVWVYRVVLWGRAARYVEPEGELLVEIRPPRRRLR